MGEVAQTALFGILLELEIWLGFWIFGWDFGNLVGIFEIWVECWKFGLGFWKYCIVCKDQGLQPQLHDASRTYSRLCRRCNRQRPHSYFAKETEMCAACKLHISFEIAACTVCGKSKNLSEMLQTADDENIYVCFTCQPEKWYFECTVCGQKNLHRISSVESRTRKRLHPQVSRL